MRLFRPLALTLVIGFLLSSATAETCSEAECRKAYSACVEGKRTVQYFAPRDCTPPVPAQVSCDCTADDYYAVYTDCDSTTRTRTATYVKYTDCVNGVPLPPAKTVKCSCSLKDLEVTFGVCDSSNNTRKIVPYFAHDCEGGDALPAPHDVPCDFKCEAGRRLNLTSPTFDCVDCPAGTVSLGGGMVFNKWGPTWPVQFHTECRSTRDGSSTCNGWAMGGTFIDSGNNTGIDSINSDLTLTFDLVMAGSLSFTYRVDSEKGWDGLVVLVDGAAKLPLTSFQPVWTLVTYALPQGLHTVVFRYQKDATGSRFLDRAFLQKIIIRGTSYADKECTSCAPGSTSDARSDSCHLCPRDTRAAGYGNPSCTACDPDQYANSGSEQCVTRPACTITDFQWLYSECSASTATRTKYAVWLQPQICNSTCPDCGLPPSTTADCAPCNPGEAPNEHHLCEACPEGTWSPGGNVACAPCNAGSAVAKSLSMKYFGSLPANATTSCEGESCGSAWRAMNEYLDSGSGHTGPVQVRLELPVDLAVKGSMSFKVRVQANYDSTFLHFYIDEDTMGYWSKWSTYFVSFRADLTAGHHVLRWEFEKEVYQDGEIREYAEVAEISLTGTRLGGALSCEACTAGTFAERGAAQCGTCPAGQWSGPEASGCEKCLPGSYTPDEASSGCEPCPSGTASEEGATECVLPSCVYKMDNDTIYDLKPLARTDNMYGPIFDPRGHSYYLNLCSKQHANNTCFDKQGHAIPSYACQVLPEGYSVDAGDMIAVYPLQDTPREGLVVTLFHGDKCASTGQGRVSNITMRCDPQAGAGYPEAEDPVEGPTCVYHFKWNTAYACPLCLPTDIETVVGGCIDGMQSTTYTYKRPVRCYGGTALPQPSQVACTVPTAFPVWAIVTIVLCSLVLITGIAILWKRNLTLTHRYNLLKDQNENFRLSDLTSTALQDEEEPHRAQDESSHRAGAGMPAASPELLAASDTGLARSADV